jgi:tRNA pseudouridine38-40 synthase
LGNYKLTIEYDGTNFFGWQRQKNSHNTIQEYIEKALEILLKEKVNLIAAGRTDTGVHAYNQVANFRTDKKIISDKFIYSLNNLIPESITIKNLKKVKDDFHSRYSAKKRQYVYNISTVKRSITKDFFYFLKYKLDFSLIDKMIKIFLGDNSFKSLCKNKDDKHNFRCHVYELKYSYSKIKNELIFSITANRFLHSMVRGIIGCLLDIGRGKLPLKITIKNFIEGEKIKTTFLPGNALFLKKIYY